MLSYQKNSALRAAVVIKEFGADSRIAEQGYTRVDPEWIAAQAGVVVIRRPMKTLLGAFVREGAPGIILNSQRPSGQTHLTCAHELGHFFHGHSSTADDRIQYGQGASKSELEADWFAYGLLTSRSTISLAMRRKGWTVSSLKNPENLYQLSLRIGVSYTAMAWSLVRLSIWSRSDAERTQAVEPIEIKKSILARQDFDPRADVWLLDSGDRDLVLEPAVGDQVVLSLPNHAPSGYLWSVEEARSEGFRLEQRVESSRNELIGSHETQSLLLGPEDRGRSAGRGLRFELSERRPWEAAAIPVSTYTSSLSFEATGDGLSSASKLALAKGISAQ